MLDNLLESKAKRARSTSGAIASVITHTVLIATALYATAQARIDPPKPSEAFRPVYFPRTQQPVSNARPSTRRPQSSWPNHRLVYVDPKVDIRVPGIDISDVLTKSGDFNTGPIIAPGSSKVGVSGAETPFLADQVEKQASIVPGSPSPRYPEPLRGAGVEGQVIAEFVVDEQGRAQLGSVRFVRSDNALFEDAVRVALGRMRFIPAEVAGRKVKQLVQMPFVFRIGR
jgi:protein TonB